MSVRLLLSISCLCSIDRRLSLSLFLSLVCVTHTLSMIMMMLMLMLESGLVQRDLVYIEDGNQLKKDDGSINLDNLVLSGTTIRKALEFQSPTYSFELDPMVLLTLEHLPGTIMDEEQLYEISLAIVPAVVAASVSAPCSPASCSRSSLEEELVPFNLCNSPSTSNSMSTIYQQPTTNSRACQR